MNIISMLNIINAQECLKNKSFSTNWIKNKEQILEYLGEYPSKGKILKLGSKLSSIFALDDESERDQSDVSVSGNAWSRLINWYLNLCLLGTNCWAVNNWEFVPPQVKRALSLKISGEKVQNSKEIIIMGYFGEKAPEVVIPSDFQGVDIKTNYSSVYKEFFNNINLNEIRVILLSAKTNCSDMLAIPLFWNFCYKGNNMKDLFEIEIGNEIERPEFFYDKKALYSVVTVPSGKESKILDGSVPGQAQLNKMQLLDAGFYWCRPSSERVNSFESFIGDNLNPLVIDAGKMVSEDFEFKDYPRSMLYHMFHC